MRLAHMFQSSLEGITPAERWHYFLQVNQLATIEAVPVDAAKYADRATEPSDEQLEKLFEEHKDQYPRPDSPDPGFREPAKVALEYFKADYDKFTSPEAISDEEVQEHYEKNKAMYDQPQQKPAEGVPAAQEPAGEKPPAAEKATESSNETKGLAEPKESKEPKETKESNENKELQESEGPKEPKEPKPEEKESKGTSAVERTTPFVFTAFAQGEPAKDEAKTAEPAAPAAKEAKPTKEPEPKVKENEEKATKEPEPAAKPEPPAGKTPETSPAAPAEAKPTETKPAEAKSGLSDELKRRIRQDIANQKIVDIFNAITERMNEYHQLWQKWEGQRIRQQGQEGEATEVPGPPKIDFDAMAKEAGISAGRTFRWFRSGNSAIRRLGPR